MYIMLYKDDVYDSVLDPFDVLNESIYLTMGESTIHSDMIPIIENSRLNTYLTESTYNYIPNTTVILDESDIIEDPTIIQDYTDYVIRPINEQHNEYQYILECIDTWIDNDYDDNLLLEMVLLERLEQTLDQKRDIAADNLQNAEKKFREKYGEDRQKWPERVQQIWQKKYGKKALAYGAAHDNPSDFIARSEIATGFGDVQRANKALAALRDSRHRLKKLRPKIEELEKSPEFYSDKHRKKLEKKSERSSSLSKEERRQQYQASITNPKTLKKRKLKELQRRVDHAESQYRTTAELIRKIKEKENRTGLTNRENAILRTLLAKKNRALAGVEYFKKNGFDRTTQGDLQHYYSKANQSNYHGQIGGKEDSRFIQHSITVGDSMADLKKLAKARREQQNKPAQTPPPTPPKPQQQEPPKSNTPLEDNKGKPAGTPTPPTPPPKQDTPSPTPPKEEHSSTPLEDNKGKPAGTPPPKQNTPVVPSNNNNQSRLSRATTLMKNNKGKIGLGVGLAVGAGLAYKNRDKLKSLAIKGWENYQQYKNRPKSVIAKRIASLRGVYKKFMLEAQRNPKQANVFKRMAAKILSVIDKLLHYMQNKADNTNRAYNPNY